MRLRLLLAIASILVLMSQSGAMAQRHPLESRMLSNVTTVTVIRLSGVVEDPDMTQLDNMATEQQQGVVALRTAIAGNVKVRGALTEAGVSDVNLIVAAQLRTGGNLTVYVR